jgi:hypothetical protein
MKKMTGSLPLGQDTKINVAVQRPSVNLKEAANVSEQAAAAVAHITQPQPTFAKHGTFVSTPHPISSAWDR